MPQISKISLQKKAKDRYNIFLDGKYAFPVSEKVLVDHKLKVGLDLDDGSIREIVQDENYEKIYNKVLNFLSYRSRTKHEVETRLREYLYKSGIDEKLTDEFRAKLIKSLDNQGLLDDSGFVRNYIQMVESLKIPPGRRKVEEFLYKKGVEREEIEWALQEYSQEAELCGAEQVVNKKLKILKTKKDYRTRNKIWQFLARKGYSPDVINTVVDSKFEV
jgi:regulatory protein